MTRFTTLHPRARDERLKRLMARMKLASARMAAAGPGTATA